MSLCYFWLLLQLRLDAVVLCAQLIDHFLHRSRRSIAVVEICSAVTVVTVEPCLCCFSGSASDSSVFGVSSRFYPSCLFHRY